MTNNRPGLGPGPRRPGPGRFVAGAGITHDTSGRLIEELELELILSQMAQSFWLLALCIGGVVAS